MGKKSAIILTNTVTNGKNSMIIHLPVPISYKEVFLALGHSDEVARELENNCKEDDRVDRCFAGLSG